MNVDCYGTTAEEQVKDVKLLRKSIKHIIDSIDHRCSELGGSREISRAVTKLQEASMWLGLELRRQADGVSCYKHGYDATNAIVDAAEETAPIRKSP